MVVRYFADIRGLTGVSEQKWTESVSSLRSLLKALASQYGPSFGARVFEEEKLSSTLIILVNGQNVEFLGGLETPLTAGDVVAIFPVVAGG